MGDMNFLYTLLLFLHILSVVLSIGPFFVLFPVLSQIKNAEGNVLRGHISTFRGAVRLVKHAGHVLVTTGVLLVWLSAWPWHSSWIVLTLAVMLGSVFFLTNAFKPVLKKFEEPDADQSALTDKLIRSVWLYIGLLLVMLWFMVDKPMLW